MSDKGRAYDERGNVRPADTRWVSKTTEKKPEPQAKPTPAKPKAK